MNEFLRIERRDNDGDFHRFIISLSVRGSVTAVYRSAGMLTNRFFLNCSTRYPALFTEGDMNCIRMLHVNGNHIAAAPAVYRAPVFAGDRIIIARQPGMHKPPARFHGIFSRLLVLPDGNMKIASATRLLKEPSASSPAARANIDAARVALQQHFGDAGSAAEVAVNLKRWMGVQRFGRVAAEQSAYNCAPGCRHRRAPG